MVCGTGETSGKGGTSETIASIAFIGAAGVARLVRADRDGRSDASYTIFAAVCIEVWCRMFIDKGV